MLARCIALSIALTALQFGWLLSAGKARYDLSKASIPWATFVDSPGMLVGIGLHYLVLFGLGGLVGFAAWLMLSGRLWRGVRRSWLHSLAATLLAHAVLLHVNAVWFDHSQLYETALYPQVAIGWVLSLFGLILLTDGLFARVARVRVPTLAATLIVLVVSTASLQLTRPGKASHMAARSPLQPDVILIGIDSLNMQVFERMLEAGELPNIRTILEGGVRFSDSFTPIGQTYSAWTSILTGMNPTGHGVRYNLAAFEDARSELSIAHDFRAQGYRTIYAIDERRFSNLNELFGFDEVIGPPGGAADFVVGAFGESPAINLLAGTRIAGNLIPHVHLNRALAQTYRPHHFDQALRQSIESVGDRPLFLATHYCIAHYPYVWRGVPRSMSRDLGDESRVRSVYPHSVRAADLQVGKMLSLLAEQGRLDNAIIVLLSDHGEGFGLTKDRVAYAGQRERPDVDSRWHGVDTFSLDQNTVLLAISTPKTRAGTGGFKVSDLVSLVDVAPTLRVLLNWQEEQADGVNLLGASDGGWGLAPTDAQRTVSVEVGFTPVEMQTMRTNPERAASGSFHFYAPNRDGVLEMKAEVRDGLLQTKERALVSGDWIVRALPMEEGDNCLVQVMDRRQGLYWDIDEVPGQIPGEALRSALCDAYEIDRQYISTCCDSSRIQQPDGMS